MAVWFCEECEWDHWITCKACYKRIKKENEKLRAEIEKLKAENEKLTHQINHVLQNNERLIDKNEKLRADYSKLDYQFDLLEATCEALRDKVEKLKNTPCVHDLADEYLDGVDVVEKYDLRKKSTVTLQDADKDVSIFDKNKGE